jgi:hypothetical protein
VAVSKPEYWPWDPDGAPYSKEWINGSGSVKSVMHLVDWPNRGGYLLVFLEYGVIRFSRSGEENFFGQFTKNYRIFYQKNFY